MEIDEQEQIITEELQELALQGMEGAAAGLIIAGEYLSTLLHDKNNESQEHKLAMSSTLACFTAFAGREIMRCTFAFR